MTHTYQVTGMTCDSCEAKVKVLLEKVGGVTNVTPDRTKQEAVISMSTHVDAGTLQEALKDHPRYQLTEKKPVASTFTEEEKKPWIQTYKPILLVFAFITGISLLIQAGNQQFIWTEWMNHFMAGFFLTFSFFKLLNVSGFADSYSTYDIVAKRIKGYGYVYPFIELTLGVAYLTAFNPLVTNLVTAVVMGVSLIGVLQTVLNRKKIRCACLGDVFNLPMSTITVIEDSLMLVMAVIMVLHIQLA